MMFAIGVGALVGFVLGWRSREPFKRWQFNLIFGGKLNRARMMHNLVNDRELIDRSIP